MNIEKHDEDKTTLHKSKDINITGVFESKIHTFNKENIQNLNKECIKENKSNSKEFVVNRDKENKIELKDKRDLDAEFVFSKANDNKKRSKKNDNEIISSWDDEANDIEICEFTDEPPKGKLIANFEF